MPQRISLTLPPKGKRRNRNSTVLPSIDALLATTVSKPGDRSSNITNGNNSNRVKFCQRDSVRSQKAEIVSCEDDPVPTSADPASINQTALVTERTTTSEPPQTAQRDGDNLGMEKDDKSSASTHIPPPTSQTEPAKPPPRHRISRSWTFADFTLEAFDLDDEAKARDRARPKMPWRRGSRGFFWEEGREALLVWDEDGRAKVSGSLKRMLRKVRERMMGKRRE
ncbi:hypothetical protein K402DRAFT_467769 [Aulographum hederae CBS 113979]|uniref:Uncharacterized protein n=1 Tax=Aulographum hederae CBS 113979 TaxID=1176131 RepID=A0A6G1GK42_9PEZI|nr:hypothetical protein K402DRAFT_467769 [Aulographum hederae CBS 113979]